MALLNFATWNIGSMLSDVKKNLQIITDTVMLKKPDVLCLQECPSSQLLLDVIGKKGGFKDSIFIETSKTHVKDGWNMGICVLSKFYLEKPKLLPLPMPEERVWYNGKEEFWHPKYFLSTGILIDETPLKIITGHGYPFYRYELEEDNYGPLYEFIDRWIKERVGEEPYIIGADFNTTTALKFMPFVSEDHYDVFEGGPTRPTGRKTDTIAVLKTAEIEEIINEHVGMDHHYLAVRTVI